jgi:hypothetical protein
MTLIIDRRMFLQGAGAATVATMLPSILRANSSDPRGWVNIGADKAYTNRPLAIADAPRVIREQWQASEIVLGFQERMRTEGFPDHLEIGDTFDWMRSGSHGEVWRDADPHGRYGQGVRAAWEPGVELTAERWELDFSGFNYKVWLPRICYNLCGKKTPLPPAHHHPCLEIQIGLRAGDCLHMGWLGPDQFPHGECVPMLKRPGGDFGPMPDLCRRDTCNFTQTAAGRGRPFMGLAWSWTADEGDGVYIVKMPREVLHANGEWAFCVTKSNGRRSQSSFVEHDEYPHGVAHVTYFNMVGHIAPDWGGTVNTWLFVDGHRE